MNLRDIIVSLAEKQDEMDTTTDEVEQARELFEMKIKEQNDLAQDIADLFQQGIDLIPKDPLGSPSPEAPANDSSNAGGWPPPRNY